MRPWAVGVVAVVSLIGLTACVVGLGLLLRPVPSRLGVLVVAAGLVPAFAVAVARRRGAPAAGEGGSSDARRTAGWAAVGVGAALALAGTAMAAAQGFLQVRLALLGWRIAVQSGVSLAPVGWAVLGLALGVVGVGLVRGLAGAVRLGWLVAGLDALAFGGLALVSSVLAPFVRAQVWLGASWEAAGGLVLCVAGVALLAAAAAPAATWAGPRRVARDGTSPSGGEGVGPGEDGPPLTRRRRPAVRTARWALGAVVVVLVAVGVTSVVRQQSREPLGDLFPDPALARCVGAQVGAGDAGGTTTRAALGEIRTLECDGDAGETPGPAIRSLEGIGALPHLVHLDLSENDVADLSPLADLPDLSTLTLTHNAVADLAPLADLTALQDLGLSGNRITDLSPLAGLGQLRFLGLADNAVTDLAPLEGLTGLVELDVSDNDVQDLGPLTGATSLTRLTVTRNAITDPSPVGGLPGLTMLDVTGNRIADAGLFVSAGFPVLDELWLGGNALRDVTPLTALPALLGVDLEGSDSSTLAGIETLRASGVYVGGLA
ncbi:leucine-rich repeat domain-containing protein [Actinotalea subterranea]|uniref:leucine-rich repeat domain-containing protein n=1 Tax=Actinotalea subterranea TaxID=2607497 RepID=UPI00165E1BA6|nr:leucine-rich repeat domain-containing protein [Actinotalea subterranea]